MANDTLSNDLLETIKKNLPKIAVQELTEILNLKKKTEDELEKSIRELTAVMATNEKLRAKLTIAEQNIHTNMNADIRQKELDARETQIVLKEEILKVRLESAQQRVSDSKEIVLAVFANNRMKYREESSVPTALPGFKGQYGETAPHVQSAMATKKVEQEG